MATVGESGTGGGAGESKTFTVAKEGELRFEVEEGWLGRIQVSRGVEKSDF